MIPVSFGLPCSWYVGTSRVYQDVERVITHCFDPCGFTGKSLGHLLLSTTRHSLGEAGLEPASMVHLYPTTFGQTVRAQPYPLSCRGVRTVCYTLSISTDSISRRIPTSILPNPYLSSTRLARLSFAILAVRSGRADGVTVRPVISLGVTASACPKSTLVVH